MFCNKYIYIKINKRVHTLLNITNKIAKITLNIINIIKITILLYNPANIPYKIHKKPIKYKKYLNKKKRTIYFVK